jgi:NADH:ubiquinone oxidoreductase subunit 5 (subunit L)/multisubunit Na+/H+ antiporter MnhA subunit
MFIIACLTNLLISLVGIFQHDIKKIIAYSTTTQLSYMFIACLLSEYTLAFFHLFNHAFFKASLFLTAGIIIHNVLNRQDIMFYKFLINTKTLLYTYFFIGLLSLSGLPFFAGFYSKDFIIEFSLLSFNFSFNFFIHLILMFSVLFTAFYSFLLLNMLF